MPYFERAIQTLTERNPNPYDGEAYYNLGCALKMQGKLDEAYENLYKSTWNAAWQDPAYFAIAQIDGLKGDWQSALDHAERSLIRNWHNHKARQLKASALRKLNRKEEALEQVNQSLKIDAFNLGCLFEKYVLTGSQSVLKTLNELINHKFHVYIEYALDFASAGLYEELPLCFGKPLSTNKPVYPWCVCLLASKAGDAKTALEYYRLAAQQSPEKCFPNRLEEINILQDALICNPGDAKAYYYLGNLWYGFRQYKEAIEVWEKSVAMDDTFPTALRNLSLAVYNKQNDKVRALKLLEKAFALDISDARILMELDQLYKKIGETPEKRLAFIEQNLAVADERDMYIAFSYLVQSIG